jgi:Spy/CpxP family protein refolding chaperone
MRTRTFAIVLTCCALAVGVVGAQNRAGQGPDRKGDSAPAPHDTRPAPRPPFKWWAIDKYKQELKLTADQTAHIETVFQASMEQLRADKDALDRAQATFSDLMERPTVTELEFSRAVDRLELARYNVSKERTTMLVRIHSILTPDQRKGLDAIRKQNDANKNRPH